MMDLTKESLLTELQDIEESIDEGSYKPGRWRQWLDKADQLSREDIATLEEAITRASNQLHRRHLYLELPFWPGFAFECSLSLAGLVCLFSDYPFVTLAGVVMLVMSLQPLIKVLTGLLMGVSYAYVYFLNVEPRFKMNFGGYMLLPGQSRVLLHLAGGLGTPLAMLLGFFAFREHYLLLANTLMLFFILVSLMQIGAFTAVWMGYPRVAGYELENLTSPAKAAAELQRYQRREAITENLTNN